MRNTVAVLFAVLTLTPAVLAQPLPLRGEIPVSAPEIAPVLETSNDARVATSGETYVATWTDLRAGEPRAYAARFLQDGTRLDPLGIDLHGDFSGSVVWSGTTYVLIYGERTKIYSRTLGGDGHLGAPVFLHDQGSDTKIDIAAASNGTTILVTGDPLPALLLDAQGNRLRTVALPWESSYRGIAVAAAGSRYLIVSGADQLRTQSVAGDGTLGASHIVAPLPVTAAVGVASDGAHFFAVWSRDHVEGQFFDANGNPEGGVRTLTNSIAASAPAVAWRGGEYFVTFSETQSQTIHSLRVSSDGIAMALPAQTTARSIEPAALVANGAKGVAVWRPRRGGLDAAFFDADSVTGTNPFRLVVPIAQAAQRQFDIRLARFASGETILGWIEVTPSGNQLRLSRGAGTAPVAPTQWPASRLIDLVVDGDVVWAVTSQSTSIYAQR
ncbi:MAG TPA: hypothetical protein VFO89_07685, partial [Thermoanaerobaculia bacterium]|nr:hypothetical protein [Thermoanaerobaculia bacterium]